MYLKNEGSLYKSVLVLVRADLQGYHERNETWQ